MKRAFLILLMSTGLAGSAFAENESGDAGRGAAYAQRVCADCHAVLSGAEMSPNPDAPSFQKVAETAGMTHRALVVWLQSSHPTMPNIMLEADDRNDVVAYILSLKKIAP